MGFAGECIWAIGVCPYPFGYAGFFRHKPGKRERGRIFTYLRNLEVWLAYSQRSIGAECVPDDSRVYLMSIGREAWFSANTPDTAGWLNLKSGRFGGIWNSSQSIKHIVFVIT